VLQDLTNQLLFSDKRSTRESDVFYLTMKGDYLQYQSEVVTGDDRNGACRLFSGGYWVFSCCGRSNRTRRRFTSPKTSDLIGAVVELLSVLLLDFERARQDLPAS
jgi:hypothetical protein